MTFLSSSLATLGTVGLLATSSVPPHRDTPELDELHRRVAVIRAQLPEITRLAEKYVPFLGQPGVGRFLVPRVLDPAFFHEFVSRAGGPPDTQDADIPGNSGLVLLPVRHWNGTALGIATSAAAFQSQGRPVVLIGPARGRPEALLPRITFIDDGAPDGDRANASINGIANMIIGWSFYGEIVAAATRAGWQPGVLLSVLMPGATAHNSAATFRMSAPAPAPIAGGVLGNAYLAAIDSVLTLAAEPAHVAQMDSIGTRLRALRQSGKKLYAGSCGHYLIEEIPRDATTSATFFVLPHGRAPQLSAAAPAKDDAMVWFGYGGFDCPNATVADSFQNLGLRVIVVSDRPPEAAPPAILAGVRLPWQLPDGVLPLPFAPGRMASLSSVDMATHYVWFRRLIATP